MDGMENFRERFEAVEAHMHAVEGRLRWWRGMACGLLIVGLISLPLPSGMATEEPQGRAHKEEHADKDNKGLAQRVKILEKQVKALQDTLAAVTFDATANELVITGANLRIVNGLGATETTNGLGNLIVGYSELRKDNSTCRLFPRVACTDVRTGSHNVVVGKEHNFSSFGGVVVGFFNEISGQFASVSGGDNNTASGTASSVSGGANNTASSTNSSVSGGGANMASGRASSVSGGGANTASGDTSSVSGGEENTASGGISSVSGGHFNTASGTNSSVSGGLVNTASGFAASVSGGENNTASGRQASVSGGSNRSAPGTDNWAAGSLLEPN
jgi:hypothetical protein